MSKINIVIIGAGAAGVAVAQQLDKTLDPSKHTLTVIASRDYFIHWPAALRLLVTPTDNLENAAALSYDRVFQGSSKGRLGSFKFAKATEVVENEGGKGGWIKITSLKDSTKTESLPWDVLMVATGSTFPGMLRLPDTKEELLQWVDSWRNKFSSAKEVLIVGGGSVGTELAGELADFHPSAKVTVAHGADALLQPIYSAKFRARVQRGLEARGVKFVLDDHILGIEESDLKGLGEVKQRTVNTKKGKTLNTDLLVPTVGALAVNTSFLTASHSPSAPSISSSVNPQSSRLQVLPSLQLKTNPRVFVAGDIVDLPEQHMLFKATLHAPVITANIRSIVAALERGEEPVSGGPGLKTYQTKLDSAIGITNGKTRGSAHFPFFFGWIIILGDWMTALLKSKHLSVSLTAKFLGHA